MPDKPDALPGRPELQAADLVRWEEGGASWRVVEVGEDRAVVELCACTGEPVDMLQGSSPDLVSMARARLSERRSPG